MIQPYNHIPSSNLLSNPPHLDPPHLFALIFYIFSAAVLKKLTSTYEETMVCPRLGCVQRWTVMTGALPLAALQLQSRAGAAVMRNKREQNCICQGGKMEKEGIF